MNILLVNMSIDLKLGGGTAERVCQLTRALNSLPNIQAKVLSTTTGLGEKLPLDASRCVLLPCLNDRWYIPAPLLGKVYRALKWSDVIIITGHWTLLNAIVYMVNKLLGRPYIFNPAGALRVFGRSGMFKKIYQSLVGERILRDAACVVAIPKEERDYFLSLGVEKDKVVVIPNGISLGDFSYENTRSFREKYHLPNAPFLLFMGRLNEIKGPDYLLQAFIKLAKQYPDLHLVMAGPDGGMLSDLQKTALVQGVADKVHFIGYVAGHDKSAAYHAAEILVVPSRMEAMSIVALEAAACGTPVVMTNVCGFSELVEAGGALEVEVSDEALMRALESLLCDQETIQVMGNKASALIKHEYTWNMAAQKHVELCKVLLN